LNTRPLLDPFRFVLISLAGWMNQQQQFVILQAVRALDQTAANSY
jgi:hypothetical protein